MLLNNEWKKNICYNRIISHRANLNGPNKERENKISSIEEVIQKNYDVEIDIWFKDGDIFLGHDFPETKVNIYFLTKYFNFLWIHCKNLESLSYFIEFNKKNNNLLNFFFHDTDDGVLTSHLYIWTLANKVLTNNSVAVLPEKFIPINTYTCFAVCTDFIES